MSESENMHTSTAAEIPHDSDPIPGLFQIYPSLAGYANDLNELLWDYNSSSVSVGEIRDIAKETDVPAPTRSQIRQSMTYLTEPLINASSAAGRMYAAVPDADTRHQLLYDRVYAQSSKKPAAQPFLDTITTQMFEGAEMIHAMHHSSDVVAREVRQSLADGSMTEYTLASRLVGLSSENEQPPYSTDQQWGLTSSESLIAALTIAAPDVIDATLEKLKADSYMGELAIELLSGSDFKAATELKSFAAALHPGLDEAALITLLSQVAPSWPNESKQLLTAQASNLRHAYEERVAAVKRKLHGIMTDDNPNQAEVLDAAIFQIFVGVSKMNTANKNPSQYTKAELIAARVEHRKRKRNQRIGEQAVEGSIDQSPETAEREPLIVEYLDKESGQLLPLSDQRFLDKKDGFLGKNPSDKLVADLDNVLSYVTATLDLSTGTAIGVKKFNNFSLTIQGESVDVFEFKPKLAPGLSLVSARGKEMRLIFSLVNDRLALLEIFDRDKLNSVLRGLGLNSGGRK